MTVDKKPKKVYIIKRLGSKKVKKVALLPLKIFAILFVPGVIPAYIAILTAKFSKKRRSSKKKEKEQIEQ